MFGCLCNQQKCRTRYFKEMKLRNKASYVIVFLIMILLPVYAYADSKADIETMRKAFQDSTKAEGVKLNDYVLVDQDGKRFHLSDYFKAGKPLAVGFAYTSCNSVCPTIIAEFKKAVDDARSKFGNRFNALVIAFDPARDTPEKIKKFGERFTQDFKDLRFATADPRTIKELTRQFGYFYVRNGDGGFDHIDMVSIVRPDGTIYRQVYGVRTQGNVIEARLNELITGKSESSKTSSLITKIAYFCTRYDPATGKYVVNYALLVGFLLEVIFVTVVFIAVWGHRIAAFSRRHFKRGS